VPPIILNTLEDRILQAPIDKISGTLRAFYDGGGRDTIQRKTL